MTLHRLALRLAAIEALAPSAFAAGSQWPTIAGPRVYDSLQTALDDTALREAVPILVVYTEDERATPQGRADYPADASTVTLIVEAMIGLPGRLEMDGKGGGTVVLPQPSLSDQLHEAMLDALEAQVRLALSPSSYTGEGAAYRFVAMELRGIESLPWRSAEQADRLAVRTISLTVRVRETAWPRPGFVAQDASGTDALPQPLRTVALALAPGSPGRMVCESVAELLRPPVVLPAPQPMHIFAGMVPGVVPDDDAPLHGSTV